MSYITEYQTGSRYSGKVLLACIMLVFVFIGLAVFMSYGMRMLEGNNNGEAGARLVSGDSVKAEPDKQGLVKGIMYNPPNSCAVINETMVHVGDKIHDIVVVGIESDIVKFAKDGLTWQQTVLEKPHAAWPN